MPFELIFSTWCSIVIIYHGIYVYYIALHIYLQQCNVSFILNQNDRSSQVSGCCELFVGLINARPVIQSLNRHFVPRIEPHALLKVIKTTGSRYFSIRSSILSNAFASVRCKDFPSFYTLHDSLDTSLLKRISRRKQCLKRTVLSVTLNICKNAW